MTWLTASELAGMPDMPSSEFRTREKLARLGVPSRPRLGREGGGGMEYDTSRLPAPTRQAIAARLVLTHAAPSATSEPEPQPVQQPAAPEPETALQATAGRRPPSDDERLCADARTALVHVLGDMAHTLGVKRAAARLALELAAGQAPRGLIETAAQANQRRRGADAMPSARTLERWLGAHREQGWWGLIPASSAPAALSTVEQDVAAVIGLYHSRDGRFRNLSAAAKEVTRQLDRPFDTWSALYKRAARALPKVDPVSLIKARHSGAQRAARLPFKRRDTTVLRPLDVWVIDG
ncbi:DNA-binding protein, partial [Piscinibacter sakaiensis]|uniref:DNA-binding protein n=1 Tax=Piscinibacter sakaiensis TaxID=1547922 RepID=UPI00273826F6